MSEPVMYGKGLNQALNLATVQAAQVDVSKILSTKPADFFSTGLDQLALLAVKHLGFPPAIFKIEAQVVKLLLYKKGDHQSCSFDQDANPGDTLKPFSIIARIIHINLYFYSSFDFRHDSWHDASSNSYGDWPQGRRHQVKPSRKA